MSQIEEHIDDLADGITDSFTQKLSNLDTEQFSAPEEYPDLVPVKLSQLVPPPPTGDSVSTKAKPLDVEAPEFRIEDVTPGLAESPELKSIQVHQQTAEGKDDIEDATFETADVVKGAKADIQAQDEIEEPELKLRQVSSEKMENRLKERQEKINDLFGDKGTVS